MSPVDMNADPVELSVRERQALSRLLAIANPQQRLTELLRQAPTAPPDDQLCREAYTVPGCLSSLWIRGTLNNGRCHFDSYSDARIVHAAVAWLCGVYSGCEPAALAGHTSTLIADAGLASLLSHSRRNALAKAWAAMQKEAATLVRPHPVFSDT